jgi:hypothetical protein
MIEPLFKAGEIIPQNGPRLTLADMVPTKVDWARVCEQQADELGEYIKNFPVTVSEKSELMELQARLRLCANELRNAP